jgi:hypothetical protein
MSTQGALGIRHLIDTCGVPPPEMELQIQWQDYELGSYPLIVLTWEDGMRRAPATYISRCQEALFAFDTGESLPQEKRHRDKLLRGFRHQKKQEGSWL